MNALNLLITGRQTLPEIITMLVSLLVSARVLMRKFMGKTCTIRVLLQIKKLRKKYVNCEVHVKKTNI